MKKRILSLLLCLALAVSLLPAVTPVTPVKATTAYQYNIVDRADYLYNITWLCQKTVSGWCGNYTFYSGTAYRLPYGQPINAGAYIGYGVSVDSFISAAKDASSVFYSSRSTYGTTNSVYYATDCSAFVSWCWGIDRKTTYSIPLTTGVTYLGMATAANTSLLQLGDCLNSNGVGHVVLVTDLTYDSSGNLTKIEITEQTPPQLKRSYYTPTELGNYYGGDYGIYRYEGEVPSAPTVITTEYYPACDSSYTSLYPALESIGVYCDWTLHCEIAELNGITNFTGTVEQNTQLLDLLKAGKLRNPSYSPIVYYPACDSSYTSLYPALESIGITCDWDLHCRIAAANGITNFTGTAEQNTQLLDLLKAGQLINPDGGSTSDSADSDTGTGVFENGYDKGYTGGMAGDGVIYAHGLDVSQWQGTALDFDSIKNAGYDYVILRAGTSYGKDTCFESYYTKARAAGLDIGTYYYTYATTVSAAQTDANNMLDWIAGKTFEYPVYFDYEDSSQDSLSTTTAKNICLTFCDAMAEAGYLTGVYTGYYKSTQLPMSEICAKYEVWIANYWDYTYQTLSPSYSTKYGMYQYTDRNYIGSNGPYDGDVAFKDYPTIVKQYGFNGYADPSVYLNQCTKLPSHCNLITTKATPLNTLPCSASSSHGSRTLVTAEAGQSYTAKALYLNTSGNYWYQITLDTGETAYLYGGHASFVEAVGSDITLSNATLPSALNQGDAFPITGKVTSTRNQLSSVTVGVYTGIGLFGTAVAEGSVTADNNSCDLSAATAPDLSTLSGGDYHYGITANYTGYYTTSSKEVTTYTDSVSLSFTGFTVQASLTYPEQCTFYPAHCRITTIAAASVNTLPCEAGSNGSAQLMEALANTVFTATGLYQNTEGTLWYRLQLDSGDVAYLAAENSSFLQELTTDLTLTDGVLPVDMTVGGSFNLGGTLAAEYNRLQKVNAFVYSGEVAVLNSAAEITDLPYSLSDLTVQFAALTAGTYRFALSADYINYYALSSTEIASHEGTLVLAECSFTVTECDHSFTTAVTQKATCTENGVLERTCSKCGQVNRSTVLATGHSYTSVTTEVTCTTPGSTTHTCSKCGDSYTDALVAAPGHVYSTAYTAPTCTAAGKTAYTCTACGDYFEEPISAVGHSYRDTVIDPGCETNGYTLHSCTACDHSYTDTLTAAAGHSYTVTVTEPTCTEAGGNLYSCTLCGDTFTEATDPATGHSYENGLCTVCGASDPSAEYYLFGYINGANYGCEEDYLNLGEYKFVDGKLTATFTQDSYVAIKSGDNLNWYMTEGWQGTAATNVVLYNTNTTVNADKLYVPGGVELTFTLTDNGDGTFNLSYTVPQPQTVLTPKYPTLSFEDEVFINVYFSAENLGDLGVDDMGLITWCTPQNEGTVDTAEEILEGATYNSTTGFYCVRTAPISAKELGDNVYFKIYIRLADGSYLYSKLLSYSPKTYASSVLSSSYTSAEEKALVVAMLNYGAAAQQFFNYKPYSLMNNALTQEQLALVSEYSEDMLLPVVQPDSSKVGIFTNSGGFTRKYPTVSFEGAFCINYYFVPSNVPEGTVKLYYWTAADYQAAATLTAANATGCITMTDNGSGTYHGLVEGIAAKDLDGTVYVAAGYLSGGTACCTGVLAYSIGSYCASTAAANGDPAPLAKATAVYGYYAKQLFYK